MTGNECITALATYAHEALIMRQMLAEREARIAELEAQLKKEKPTAPKMQAVAEALSQVD